MGNVNAIFKGKWIVRYNSKKFLYRQVLEALTNMGGEGDENERDALYKQVTVNKGLTREGIHFEAADGVKDLQLNIGGVGEVGGIKNIRLVSPVRMNDKRWDTIHFTTASLFLGSALTGAGFNVSVDKLVMPVTTVEKTITDADLVGFTLFEDLYAETRSFFDMLSPVRSHGLLAAGGPMVTLNPLQTAGHLPELNLLVRGEAEFVLPRLLEALNNNDLEALLKLKGFLFQVPGLIIISDLGVINRPDDFSGFRFNLDFLERERLERGLEINLSRGCSRGCIFCSHVQGRKLRKLPPKIFDQLLTNFTTKVFGSPARHGRVLWFPAPRGQKGFWPPEAPRGAGNHSARPWDFPTLQTASQIPETCTININDDDILQDMDYAESVFGLIKKHGFKLWGVQTSVDSFFKPDHTIDYRVLDVLADGDLFVEPGPLVWVGTDAFLKKRGKRLGKWIPPERQLHELMDAFEERGIRNYHYWISSDHDSDWEEFASEFRLIYGLREKYGHFGLLAHSPFLVPYSTTPLYRLLTGSGSAAERIKYKQVLRPGNDMFRFRLVDRVETGYAHLNRLLNNERLNSRLGFFDYLKEKDYLNAFITLYDFLKMERLSSESANDPSAEKLHKTEKKVEKDISKNF